MALRDVVRLFTKGVERKLDAVMETMEPDDGPKSSERASEETP